MSSLANVRILKSYYALLIIPITPIKSEALSTNLWGYNGTTISKQLPQLRGEITWVWTKNNKYLRERLFQLQGRNNRLVPLAPDRVRPIFRSSKYLLLDKIISVTLKNGIRAYVKDFYNNLSIKEFENCPHCRLLHQITLMTPKKYYRGLNEDNICQQCALQELYRELKSRSVRINNPAIQNYIRVLLQQSKNVPECLEILSGTQKYGTGSIIKESKHLTGEHHDPTPLAQLKEIFKNRVYILKNLRFRKILSLLPAQVKALQAGLLKGNDLLIVAETSAGKTLVGEMAALRIIIEQKKQVMYLCPLVALANTKYESFRTNFQREGFKIGLRVGLPRIKLANRKFKFDSMNLNEKDIIVGTYEGFDQLLRSGQAQSFKNVGLVIVDEIQELAQKDRGPDLDGLISRLRLQKSKIQIIGLSATIGNPRDLANMLKLELVQYSGRPIPLELHVLISPSELSKKDRIAEIIDKEKKIISKFGFKGQSIIFTNSRRKTKELRDFLRNSGIRTANYHSGLAYGTRKRVEEDFDKGKLDAVAATYALGAGVDFPASTVIFESVQMGKELLSDHPNIFFQMMGRAGRLGKHEKGKVIILATPFPPNSFVQMSELEVAMKLLNTVEYEKVEPEYDINITATQLLATLSSFGTLSYHRWKNSFDTLIGRTGSFEKVKNFLLEKNLVLARNDSFTISKIGRAGSLSFLTITEIEFVIKKLNTHSPLEIAINMEPFENINLSARLTGFIERALKTRVGSRLFNSNALELLDSASVNVAKLDRNVLDLLMKWSQLFFNCGDDDSPYCDHGMQNINKLLVQLRLNGYGPNAIAQYIDKKFGFTAYSGDILRWLESLLHRLEGVHKIVSALDTADTENQINIMIESIEDPDKVLKAETLEVFNYPL